MDKHVDELFQALTTIRASAQLIILQSGMSEDSLSNPRLAAIVDQTRRMELSLRELRRETGTLVMSVVS